MSHDIDPEDENAIESPSLGKVYEFAGVPLEPYSIAREDLYTRLTFDPLSEREAAGLLMFICTQSPERCVMVRGKKQEEAFRVECVNWLESKGWMTNAALRMQAIEAHRQILADIEAAQTVEPDFPKGAPGK